MSALSNAKTICKYFKYDWTAIQGASVEQLLEIYGVGDVMADAYVRFFDSEKNKVIVKDILQEIQFQTETSLPGEDQIFEGCQFRDNRRCGEVSKQK